VEVVAAETAARVAPKKTILFEGVALKLLPVIVTAAPVGPLVGKKLLIHGAWAKTSWPYKTRTKSNNKNCHRPCLNCVFLIAVSSKN
jgi:hypothetical protein